MLLTEPIAECSFRVNAEARVALPPRPWKRVRDGCAMVPPGVTPRVPELALGHRCGGPASGPWVCRLFASEAAKESNLPSGGLHRPAGFEGECDAASASVATAA
jgi:hypothetical protein